MDEGLLTLEAEWFLMTLPKQLIPRMTCLVAPDLLNQLVVQWSVEHSGHESVKQFTLPAGLNLTHFASHETAISVELVNLCKWLNLTQNTLHEDDHSLKAA
jgi:hypothetical protein